MDVFEAVLWLTLNVYYEARGEPLLGQVAIVDVTMNRAKNKGKTIKEVVLAPAQFSWTTKASYFPEDPKAFWECMCVVFEAIEMPDVTHGATHYHNNSVDPYWAEKDKIVARWGDHTFYKGIL